MMRLQRILTAAILAVCLLALAAAPVTQAQTQSLYWERFDVDITVLPNGDLRVEETQVINFTSGVFTEGFAELSTANTDGIRDVTVSEDGRAYEEVSSTCCVDAGEFAVDRLENGNLEVVWDMGRTQNETRTFVLGYTVEGAIRRYEQGNEFQWNAVSPGLHDFEIRESRVTVRMPEGVPITYADYLVPPEFSGVPMAVEVAEDGESAVWVAQAPLAPSEGIQIVVQFPPGTVGGGPPAWQAEFDRMATWEETYKPWVDVGLVVLALLILLGGPALLYAWWYLRGRDPQVEGVPEYITAPPSDLPPGIAGTLLDEQADVQDVIATLMDLARRGYLVIEETAESNAFRLVSKDFVLRATPGEKSLQDLNDYERQLFNAIFRGRETVRLRDLNQKFYTSMAGIQNKLYETAHRQGYFRALPESTRQSYGCLGTAVLVIAVVGGFFSLGAFGEWTSTLLCPFLAAAVVAIAMLVASRHMPAKTRKGSEAAALSRAFKQYLANLEKYADPQTVTDQFEKYLPWAIAFGLERTWINRFKRIPTTPMPGWYYPVGRPYMGRVGNPRTVGTSGAGREARPVEMPQTPSFQEVSDSLSGGLQSISDGLNTMLNSAARTLTSTPPASSTSSGGRSFRGGGGGFRSSGGSGGGGRGFR